MLRNQQNVLDLLAEEKIDTTKEHVKLIMENKDSIEGLSDIIFRLRSTRSLTQNTFDCLMQYLPWVSNIRIGVENLDSRGWLTLENFKLLAELVSLYSPEDYHIAFTITAGLCALGEGSLWVVDAKKVNTLENFSTLRRYRDFAKDIFEKLACYQTKTYFGPDAVPLLTQKDFNAIIKNIDNQLKAQKETIELFFLGKKPAIPREVNQILPKELVNVIESYRR